jgi:hypothetical protein
MKYLTFISWCVVFAFLFVISPEMIDMDFVRSPIESVITYVSPLAVLILVYESAFGSRWNNKRQPYELGQTVIYKGSSLVILGVYLTNKDHTKYWVCDYGDKSEFTSRYASLSDLSILTTLE